MADVLDRGSRGVRISVSKEEVVKFLGSIPLVQQLPRTSVQRPVDVVEPLYYETIVPVKSVHKSNFTAVSEASEPQICTLDEEIDGVFVVHILTYEAKHLVPNYTIWNELQVICLVLHNKDADLLNSTSIWAQQPQEGGFSIVECILQLETIKVDLFQGFTREEFPSFGYVYGGQLVSQALAAACKTVNPVLLVHSLHAYFIRAGNIQIPILYKVERIRDGQTFATRQVSAIQKGKVIFFMLCSFQRLDLQKRFEHQEAMPIVPSPDQLLSLEELQKKYPPTSPWDIHMYNLLLKCPLDVKMVEPFNTDIKEALEPRQSTWIKTKGKLTDDPALHRCAAAHASDWTFLETSKKPHQEDFIRLTSLDHSMWFHKPFKANEWLLFVQSSPCASSGRALVYGNFFNRQGELVISASQEGLMRKFEPDQVLATSKL